MGFFEYLFTKCVQKSAGQAVPNFKTVRQRVSKNNSRVLRRSEYFKSDNSSKQASKCDNILDTGGVLDPCNPIVFWVPIFDCCCCKTRSFIKVKIKVALNEKRKKLLGFSFPINIANIEAFL